MTERTEIIDLARRTVETEIAALEELKARLGAQFVAAVEAIRACTGKCVVTGMGKSGHVGRKIAATLASTGTPSFFLHPAEAFHGDLGMLSKEDVVLALCHSGETDEILRIVPFIRDNGNTLIAMTGHPASTLAQNADMVLDVSVAKEACPLNLAPTSSTTAQMVMGDALAVTLMQLRGFETEDFARLHPGGSLGRRLLMTVGQAMRTHDLPVITADTSATDLIHAISKGGVGLAVICNAAGYIEGLITDGDVRRAMINLRDRFFDIEATDIATRAPLTVAPATKLLEAEELMTGRKITALLVADADNRLQGVIRIYDIKI